MSEQAIATQEAGIGHNRLAFLDFYRDQNADLRTFLTKEYAGTLENAAALKAKFDLAPTIIDTDELERQMTDLGGDLGKLIKTIAAQKKVTKEPLSAAVGIADDFFAALHTPTDVCMRTVERRVNAYKDEKRSAAQRAREEEERKAAEMKAEAERLAAEAKRIAAAEEAARAQGEPAEDVTQMYYDRQIAEKEAHRATLAAREAASVAAAPIAAPAKVKGDTGTASIQRTTWTGEIEDINALDLEALRPYISRAALDSAVKAFAVVVKDTRPLAGARVFAKTSTSFRG